MSCEQPDTLSAWEALDDERDQENIRRAAAAARTEDEYLEALRAAGSLGSGIRIVAPSGCTPPPARPAIPPFDPTALSTERLSDYVKNPPHDAALRERYFRDPIVATAVRELEARRTV